MNNNLAIAILQNPWHHNADDIQRARAELELAKINHCPHGFGECQDGCCYPGRCGKFRNEDK